MPAIPSAARRATRVIDSESDSEAVDELDDDHGDSDGMSPSVVADAVSEIEEAEPEPEPEPEPERPKIRLRMPARKPQRSTRTAAIKASARAVAQAQASAKEEEEEEDELDEEEEEEAEDVDVEEEEVEEESGSRAPSPSKMTARQRARLTEGESHLMALPDGFSKPKPELTEAERLQKREEMARRRKRQNEQRLQDEQDQTINRLLRAQTGRSRTKLDDTDTPRSGQVSPVKARVVPDAVRWVSRMHGEDVVLRVGVKAGREAWIAVGEEHVPRFEAAEPGDLVCAAQGCALPRKYRSVGKPSVGGCSVAHLKEVNARVARGEL